MGGVFSTMFGSGGFIYAMYLSRRLPDKDAVRATQSTPIGLSTFTRVIIFAVAGIYNDWSLLTLAACLVPAMVIGIYAGHRITLRPTREQFCGCSTWSSSALVPAWSCAPSLLDAT